MVYLGLFEKYVKLHLIVEEIAHEGKECTACAGKGYIIEGFQGYCATLCEVCGGKGYVHRRKNR